jgi:CBS domain-containing protein
MKIAQLLTPISEVRWLSVSDTVREAFEHMEAYELTAAPLLDWDGRYLGTVTEADLRRVTRPGIARPGLVRLAVARPGDRSAALSMRLADVERRSTNVAVTIDCDVASVRERASMHRFVPVVDDCGKLLGIVDRRRILELRPPCAA